MMPVHFLCSSAALAVLVLCGCGAQASSPAGPERPAAASDTRCAFGAFVQEDDPAGLNMRDAPGLSGAVLGTLPPTLHGVGEFKMDVRIEVEVSGARGGWFHVAHAQDNDVLTGRPARPVYAGAGWVSGRKLTVKSQATAGRAAPGMKAEAVARFADGSAFDGDEMVAAGHLVGCQGGWAQVEFADAALSAPLRKRLTVNPAARAGLPNGVFRIWLDQVCGVQETTCDGLADGDQERPEAQPPAASSTRRISRP